MDRICDLPTNMLPTTNYQPRRFQSKLIGKVGAPTRASELQTRAGFTLIELLLYVSLASFMLLTISIVLSFMFQSRVKSQAISEVYEQGASVLQVITQQARNANSINSPAQSVSATSLSLAMVSVPLNPTIFDLLGGTIRITEGAQSPVALTSPRVVVSNLFFHNLTRNGTGGIIRVSFIISNSNPSNLNEYSFTRTFYGSATVKY